KLGNVLSCPGKAAASPKEAVNHDAAAPAYRECRCTHEGNGARNWKPVRETHVKISNGDVVPGQSAKTAGGLPRWRSHLGYGLVGAAGFEPTTPCPPDKCANRAAPRPDRNGADYRDALVGTQPSPPVHRNGRFSPQLCKDFSI